MTHATATPYLRPSDVTEAQFQRDVIAWATMRGWMVHHTRPARKGNGGWVTPIQGDVGFPDLVLVRDGRLIFAELKSQKGRLTEPQRRWLDLLGSVVMDLQGLHSIRVVVWRPSDWPDVVKYLDIGA